MVSDSSSGKGVSSGEKVPTVPGDHHGDHGGKEHHIPDAYRQEHEHRGYASKSNWEMEPRSSPFWHPAPKDMPEPPVHFQNNPIHLEMHLGDPRQRLAGMTDKERAWRKKFVLDQRLKPEEPLYVPEFHGNFNPIRRIYRWPLDTLERRVLIPALGYQWGHLTRAIVPKIFFAYLGTLWFYYHIKYNHPTWIDHYKARAMIVSQYLNNEDKIREEYPGLMEKGWRHYPSKVDYMDQGFKDRWSHLKLDPPVRP